MFVCLCVVCMLKIIVADEMAKCEILFLHLLLLFLLLLFLLLLPSYLPGVGLFVDSYLTEIILEVVHNAAIPGYLAASSRCELSILGQF